MQSGSGFGHFADGARLSQQEARDLDDLAIETRRVDNERWAAQGEAARDAVRARSHLGGADDGHGMFGQDGHLQSYLDAEEQRLEELEHARMVLRALEHGDLPRKAAEPPMTVSRWDDGGDY